MPVDDFIKVAVSKTVTHNYTRCGQTVTLDTHQEGGQETKTRVYQSVHAAVCAFGRLRAEPSFRADWQASVAIQLIRAARGTRKSKQARPFTAEVIALALLAQEGIEEGLEAVLPALRRKQILGEPLLTGSARLRKVLAEENHKIRQEVEE